MDHGRLLARDSLLRHSQDRGRSAASQDSESGSFAPRPAVDFNSSLRREPEHLHSPSTHGL